MPKSQKRPELPRLPDGLAIELQAEVHIIVQLTQKYYPKVQEMLDQWEGQADCPYDLYELRKQLTQDVQNLTTRLILNVTEMTRWWQVYISAAQHEIDTRASQAAQPA